MNNKKNQKEVWGKIWQNAQIELNFDRPESQWIFFDKIKFKYLCNLIPRKPAETLEVGCGSANVSFLLAQKGYQTTLLDFSDEALTMAKQRFQLKKINAKFISGDAESLPFKNDTFDLVMSFGLLEHFENPQRAISEMTRVLKPGGIFLSDILTKRFSALTIGKLLSLLIKIPYHLLFKLNFKKVVEDYNDLFKPGFYENSLSAKAYKNFMSLSGLSDIKIVGSIPFPPLYVSPWMEKNYIKILGKFAWINKLFTNSSKFSLFWCISWMAYGIKNENHN